MHTKEIKYMCMFAYAFLHGEKVFNKIAASAPNSYKFVNLVFACTGGGTLVPIFINAIPVSLAVDSYPIAIGASFILHNYVPILREVLAQSDLLRVRCCFEFVVTWLLYHGDRYLTHSRTYSFIRLH